MDMKSLLSIFDENTETNELLEVNDSFDIELGEDLLIETGVLELAEDGVIVAADEDTLKLLEEHGAVLEDTDWSKYDSPAIGRKQPPRTDYNVPTHMRKAAGEQPKTGFDKRRASLIKQGILKADESLDEGLEMSDLGRAVAQMMNPRDKQRFRPDQIDRAVDVVVDQEGFDVDPRDRNRVAEIAGKVIQMLNATSGRTIHEFMDTGSGDDGDGDDDMKDRIIQMYKEDGLRETEIAKLEGISELEVHKIIDAHERGMDEGLTVGISDELAAKKIANKIKGMPVNYKNVAQYITKYLGMVGKAPTDVSHLSALVMNELEKLGLAENEMDEAKYQGREVPLGKPMKGDVKKSKVYVKKPNGKVVKVNFGDKKMRIKKSNPKRRKSFRARHNCKNPGPRWKARYWSCRAW